MAAAVIAVTQTDLKPRPGLLDGQPVGIHVYGFRDGPDARGSAGAMFHLVTHAFFKALLFLGAGSVMHAMGGVIDMRRFGGLRKL